MYDEDRKYYLGSNGMAGQEPNGQELNGQEPGGQELGSQEFGSRQSNGQEPYGQERNGQALSGQDQEPYRTMETNTSDRPAQAGGWEPRRANTSYIPEEPKKPRGKKHSMARKAALVTAAALLFGTVAGGTMFAVDVAGEYVRDRYLADNSDEETKVTVAQAETQDSDKNDSVPVTSAIQTDVSAIVEQAMPSVVAINNTMLLEQQTGGFGWWAQPQTQTVEVPSSGSGIIVGKNDDELLVVTNNHVVADSKELTVTFIDDKQVDAVIKGTDADSDLAVIAIPVKNIEADTMSKIKVATLGDSDALKVGQGVVAIGNALGYGQSVTVGYVSAVNRQVKAEDNTSRSLLQTDAAINPGNSGGALLNMKGEVIGINAAKYSSTEVEGMGYAIPVSQAKDIINGLMNIKTRTETVAENEQGYLGIQGTNIDETAASMYGMPRGVYVYKILEDSAAAKSGLKEKDIITKFDGRGLQSMEDLKRILTFYKGGETVDLTVQSLENGQYTERTVQITLAKRPAAETNS